MSALNANLQFASPCLLFTLLLFPQIARCQTANSLGAFSKSDQISEYFRRVFEDRQGRIWLGTNEDGVACYDGHSLRFFTVKDGLAGRAVRGILEDQSGCIWFATDTGVGRYIDGKIESFTVNDGLQDNDVWSIALDHLNTIWVGTKLGVCRWNGKSFTAFELPATNVRDPNSQINPKLVWTIYVDRVGRVWIGTDGSGLFQFDGKTTTSFTTEVGLPSNQISSIVQDKSGKLWFAFVSGGVCSYDGNQFKSFSRDAGLPDGWVWTLLISNQGNLLASVLGSGVYRLSDEKFLPIEANLLGLPKHVQSLMDDSKGNLWFGCSGGLFQQHGLQLVNINKSGPWFESNQAGVVRNPLEPFTRLVGGDWVVTASSGKKMYHTWKWGPGKNSIERWTTGEGASGDPWRELIVYYWHPRQKKIQFVGFSPFASGINVGTIDLSGQSAIAISTLTQTSGVRQMETRWKFKNPDLYTETLLEKDSSGKLIELVSFDHRRTQSPSSESFAPIQNTDIPKQFEAFKSLIGKPWTSSRDSANATSSTSIDWIPLANLIHAQVTDIVDEQRKNRLSVFIYQQRDSKLLRCLAFGEDSQIYEGSVRILSEAVIELDLKRSNSSSVVDVSSTLEQIESGRVKQSIHIMESDGKATTRTVLHKRLE